MSDARTPNTKLIEFIDGWLDENGWRLDERTADFALDVRLIASGTVLDPVPDAPDWVAELAGV
jgi:hypothetical protein